MLIVFLLLNDFNELKNQKGKLLYKIDNKIDTIFFYFPIKDFNFIIDLKRKEVYYRSCGNFLNKDTLLLLYKIVDLFEKEFFNSKEKNNESDKYIFDSILERKGE